MAERPAGHGRRAGQRTGSPATELHHSAAPTHQHSGLDDPVPPPFGGGASGGTTAASSNPFGLDTFVSSPAVVTPTTDLPAATGHGSRRRGGADLNTSGTSAAGGTGASTLFPPHNRPSSTFDDVAPPPPTATAAVPTTATTGSIDAVGTLSLNSSLPDFLRFGPTAGVAGAAGVAAGPSATAATAAAGTTTASRRSALLAPVVDASTETVELLTVDDEISLAARELRALSEKLSESNERLLGAESKALLLDDEMRNRQLAAERGIDAAKNELLRATTAGRDYMGMKIQQMNDERPVEARKIYDELKGYHEQRRASRKQMLLDERARLQKEVGEMTQKRDLLEEENGGANETKAARKITKAKTVAEKIAVAAEMAAALAQNLKQFTSLNVRDLVRSETIRAFEEIRRGTQEQRQRDKAQRTAGMVAFQRDAVARSQELLRARDEARQRRMREHQELLERARNRATKATTESTQALLDHVTSSHDDAMRKFKIEFDSQHDHLREMHSLVVKDDKQLDEQKIREARQRFQAHRKMSKELLDADAQSLAHAKEREAAMWAETTAEADPNAAQAIAQSVMSSVVRGTADVQRRLSTVSTSVRAQIAAMERQSNARKIITTTASSNGSKPATLGLDNLEETAAVGELKKMLAAAMERRVDQHKRLEAGVQGFVQIVEQCGSIAQVQRNEVKATSQHAMSAQAQWENELRRMMSDFSIIAATKQQHQQQQQQGLGTSAAISTTPVGFLLSTIADCVERLSSQAKTVSAKVVRPVERQRALLAAAVREDAERQSAHSAVNAKVMQIFRMFEAADAAMDSVRQREDEVRVEEISLAAQQRQLAEERRSFSVKCESLKRAVEQTERESAEAQAREREARMLLADSERQLAALAIEQRTLVARAATDSGAAAAAASAAPSAHYDGMTAVRASTFVDPMAGVSPSPSRGAGGRGGGIHPMYRGFLADRTNMAPTERRAAGGAATLLKPTFVGSAAATMSSDAERGGDRNAVLEDDTHGAYDPSSSADELRRMKARFNAAAAARGRGGALDGTTTSTSQQSAASPGGHQADVSGGERGGDSSTASGFSGVYAGVPVRGAGMSAMAAAVSPPATMSSRTQTTSSRR